MTLKLIQILNLTSCCVFVLSVNTDKIRVVIDSDCCAPATTFTKIVTLHNESNQEQFNVTTKNPSFFIIQVHTYGHNVSLSGDPNFTNGTYTTGADIGLVQHVKDDATIYDFYLQHSLVEEKVLIAINVYSATDPIPGGCNMVFETEEAPYQKTICNVDMITVDVQPASHSGHFCENQDVELTMYYMYLYEKSEDTYFETIVTMMTPMSITNNALKVRIPTTKPRHYFSNYHVGVVYGVIASFGNNSSAYVPVASLDCIDEDISHLPLDILFLLCGIVTLGFVHDPDLHVIPCFGFWGTYMYMQMNLAGCLFVAVIIPISACLIYNNNLCKLLTSVTAGYLFSLFFMGYPTPYDAELQDNFVYWASIITITLLIGSCFHIIGLSSLFVGYYYLFVSYSDFSGGFFYYLLKNNLRRIHEPYFNHAVMIIPDIYTDKLCLVIIWATIIIYSCGYKIGNKNSRRAEETTPLLP